MRPFRIPLRVPFRGLDERRGVLLRGPHGWGELSPFPDYSLVLTARWLSASLEASEGTWPEPLRSWIPVNVTVPAVTPEEAAGIVARSGCATAKVKVAAGDDVARVEAVRAALGPGGRLRVDANGAWDIDTARHRIKALAPYDIEYVEQPVETIEDMARLRRKVDVPLAVDESIRTAEDPLYVNALDAADVVVLKVHPLGGVRPALRVAESCGLPVVVSSALETSVGMAAGVALAAALPELPYACGLATVELLEGDLVSDPLRPVRGSVEVRRPRVDEDALRRYAVEETEPDIARLLSLARAAAGAAR
ncbi:o-succinylbenzoate synthase [soil metagenome]